MCLVFFFLMIKVPLYGCCLFLQLFCLKLHGALLNPTREEDEEVKCALSGSLKKLLPIWAVSTCPPLPSLGGRRKMKKSFKGDNRLGKVQMLKLLWMNIYHCRREKLLMLKIELVLKIWTCEIPSRQCSIALFSLEQKKQKINKKGYFIKSLTRREYFR